jgi:hypothetical protein
LLKDRGRELNVEASSAEGEEKSEDGEGDWLDCDENIVEGTI